MIISILNTVHLKYGRFAPLSIILIAVLVCFALPIVAAPVDYPASKVMGIIKHAF